MRWPDVKDAIELLLQSDSDPYVPRITPRSGRMRHPGFLRSVERDALVQVLGLLLPHCTPEATQPPLLEQEPEETA